jgi:hypothetical protein
MRLSAWIGTALVSAFIMEGTPSILAAEPDFVAIEYGPASGDVKIDHARDVLINAKALEKLRVLLSPLRWPTRILVRAAQCGAERRDYDPATHTATICFENVAHILDIAASAANASDEERGSVAVGASTATLLHQVAYAIFDVYHVPIWGRIDDAADNLSALVMTQFGSAGARTTILGTAMFFDWSGKTWTGSDFASSASPEAQRFYNFLCVAIGADPFEFGMLVDMGVMPMRRAVRCHGEYEQIRKAFNLRIMPYVDPDRLVQARARQW